MSPSLLAVNSLSNKQKAYSTQKVASWLETEWNCTTQCPTEPWSKCMHLTFLAILGVLKLFQTELLGIIFFGNCYYCTSRRTHYLEDWRIHSTYYLAGINPTTTKILSHVLWRWDTTAGLHSRLSWLVFLNPKDHKIYKFPRNGSRSAAGRWIGTPGLSTAGATSPGWPTFTSTTPRSRLR